MRNRFPRTSYVPAGAVKVADKHSSAVAYLYERNGVLFAIAFAGKADKPAWHYRFRNAANREADIARHFASVQAREKSRADRRTSRKAFAHTVQCGDIYRTSWGYDQTNVEFFEVVEVRGKYAILREIECASRSDGQGSDRVVPQSGAYLAPRYAGDDRGLPLRRLIQERGIKIDYVRTARPWGKRVAGVVIGAPAYCTSAGWGH